MTCATAGANGGFGLFTSMLNRPMTVSFRQAAKPEKQTV